MKSEPYLETLTTQRSLYTRPNYIARSMGTVSGSGGRTLRIESEMGGGYAHTAYLTPDLSKEAAKTFLAAAEREKREMQALNDRLGSYIERVKKLETTNRTVVDELNTLRGSWGVETKETKVCPVHRCYAMNAL